MVVILSATLQLSKIAIQLDNFYTKVTIFRTLPNNRPHGALNLRTAETPNDAFIRKMRPEIWFGFAVKLFK
jgi:hypothetical protein